MEKLTNAVIKLTDLVAKLADMYNSSPLINKKLGNLLIKEKIFITGTGRCGTTFLIKLFTFLDYDTGFNTENYQEYIFEKCNSGMEKPYTANNYILKNPEFLTQIEDIRKHNITIKYVILPIRDYKTSALSRVSHDRKCGGLWCAYDEHSQINFYKEIMANYIYLMTKYEINTIFIDFDKMICSKEYLFDKLKNIMDEKEISFEFFSKKYDEVTLTSKPK
jgi:hypothetical protein